MLLFFKCDVLLLFLSRHGPMVGSYIKAGVVGVQVCSKCSKGCRTTAMSRLYTFFLLFLSAITTFAISISKETLESFASNLDFSVTSNQLYINIPASYSPWDHVSVFQYGVTDSLSWASNSTAYFLDCNESNCDKGSSVTDMGLTNQIGTEYGGQPNSDSNYITYVSPKFLGSTTGERNVTFVVSVDYNNGTSLYALVDANFI